jgi:hypothetical protein
MAQAGCDPENHFYPGEYNDHMKALYGAILKQKGGIYKRKCKNVVFNIIFFDK